MASRSGILRTSDRHERRSGWWRALYYNAPHGDGERDRDRQPTMWVATTDLPTAVSHPFYARLNRLLADQGFDDFAETACAGFYADTMGRPGVPPGVYFRLLFVGYFEGLDSERGIAWRAADSLMLRDFLGLALHDAPPDHSTISRTRRLIDLETHRQVFTWVLERLATVGLVKGKTIGIDATTLEANAALRSIVRRDTGESYQEFLTKLAEASGIKTPTRAALARLDPCRTVIVITRLELDVPNHGYHRWPVEYRRAIVAAITQMQTTRCAQARSRLEAPRP